jgi:hypothetical protein
MSFEAPESPDPNKHIEAQETGVEVGQIRKLSNRDHNLALLFPDEEKPAGSVQVLKEKVLKDGSTLKLLHVAVGRKGVMYIKVIYGDACRTYEAHGDVYKGELLSEAQLILSEIVEEDTFSSVSSRLLGQYPHRGPFVLRSKG